MSTVTLASLIGAPSVDDWRATLLGFLSASPATTPTSTVVGFPVTSWSPTGAARGLVEMEADALTDLGATVTAIANGGYLDYATGDWLTLLVTSVYAESRLGSVTVVGTAVLANATGSPIVVGANTLTLQSLSALTYTNSTGGTIPAFGTLSITIVGASPGTAYNVGNGEIVGMLTPLPGVSVSNPAVGSTGTWISVAGVDTEQDAALRARCRAKWGALGAGGNKDAYIYWTTTSSPQVTRVGVLENVPSAGNVTVLVAGPAGAIVDATVMATINTYVQLRRPLSVRVYVQSASNQNVRVRGNVTVKAAYLLTAQTAVAAALQSLFANYGIGALVRVSDITLAIASVAGVVEVGLLTQSTSAYAQLTADDVALSPTQVATYTNELTWISV